jgi:hypothetical protein
MIRPFALASALLLLGACADSKAAALAAAGSVTTSTGPATGASQPIGEGSVWTYVVSDGAGKPVEVGVRIPGAALNGLSADTGGHPPTPMVLAFPGGAATGVINHVEFYWQPSGHEPPGAWDKPHFDFHFFLADASAARAIDPNLPDFATKAARVLDPKYVPVDFVAPPGDPVKNTIPGMGLHFFDRTQPPIPGRYVFTQTMIHGSYDGQDLFIEPMITRDWLLTHPSLDEPLKQPQAYQRSGLYPTTYSVHYDAAKDEYSVALGGFTERQAS